jgi:hypothetical protein
LRAVGSEIRCCASVASFGRPRLAKPIASRTAARSDGVMAGAAMDVSFIGGGQPKGSGGGAF